MTGKQTRGKRKRHDRKATKGRRGKRKGDGASPAERTPEPWERPSFRQKMIRKGGRP